MTSRRRAMRRISTPVAANVRQVPGVGAVLAIGLAGVGLTACRSEPQRSAMAQVPDRDEAVLATSAVTPEPTVRRLWAGSHPGWISGLPTWVFNSVSPDGRFLSTVDWSTIDLAVRDLRTGRMHRLTNAVRGPDRPYEDAGASVFSPDGRRILYAWQVAPDVQLRSIDFAVDEDGVPHASEPAVVFDNPEFEPYFPFDWSPDGKEVVAKVWMGGDESHTHGVTHLALISTTDGTYRALKSFDWREPLRAAFSPDGRFVAYDLPPEPDSRERDVFVVAVDGTYEARIAGGPSVDRLLDWHPNGWILFHSDREGTPGVWRIPMTDGRAATAPELLRADMWGVEPLGSTDDGFYYGLEVDPPRLYTAALDLAGGRLVGTKIPMGDPNAVQILGWDWSPDGDHLVYSAGLRGRSGSVIGVVSSDGKEIQALSVGLEPTEKIRWHPDGGSVAVSTMDSKGRFGLYRVALESGSVSTILSNSSVEGSLPDDRFFDLSPDGQTIYFGVADPDRASDAWLKLVSHDIPSGEQRDLGPIGWPGRIALAPDGSTLAAVVAGSAGGGAVGTISASGGSRRALYELADGEYAGDIDWTPDGESVVFFTQRSGPDGTSLARLMVAPVRGGAAREIDLGEGVHPKVLRLHPDGRRIAFKAGDSRGEIWVMEGLGAPHVSAGTGSAGPR